MPRRRKPQTMARARDLRHQGLEHDRKADFNKRQFDLIRAAAEAPFTSAPRRGSISRASICRGRCMPEAKAVLDTAIADERPTAEDPAPLVLRAVANIMLGRADAAQKDLANPVVGNQNDAPLWRALAFARAGKWAEARDAFRNVEGALGALPLELQRMALKDALRASVEVGDFTGAASRLNDFQVVGLSTDIEPAVSVLTGRLAERSGRIQDALAAYRIAAASSDRPAAAQGRLREIALRYSLGEIKQGRTHRRAGEPHHRLARRRDRGRGLADAGAALHRGGPLPRRLPRHAHGADGVSELAADPRASRPRRPRPSTPCSSPARATRCRRSTRSACSTTSAS